MPKKVIDALMKKGKTRQEAEAIAAAQKNIKRKPGGNLAYVGKKKR